MFELVFSKEALDFYNRLYYIDKNHFIRIDAALELLKSNPYKGKALTRGLKGMFSLRVGMYRVLYNVDHQIISVQVLRIGHRKDVYN